MGNKTVNRFDALMVALAVGAFATSIAARACEKALKEERGEVE